MTRGYWLVGDAPIAATAAHPELWMTPDDTGIPHVANRLLSFTGWTMDVYMRVFVRRTHVWRQPRPMWIDQGRERARLIAEESVGSSGVVIIGEHAAMAFRMEHDRLLEWVGRFVRVPTPHGMCSFWSEVDAHERARAFFESLRVSVCHGQAS